jgi:hypothetical protein
MRLSLDKLPPGAAKDGKASYPYIEMVMVGGERDPGSFYMESAYRLLPWRTRLYRWAVRWESCRTFWGSHGCDKRRGHMGRHRCGGLIFDRCCRGYEAPPWWAPGRADTTSYFGEDVPGREERLPEFTVKDET